MSAPATPRPTLGIIATAANFPIVFVGIIAITALTSGDDEIALVNLWALWGFLQALAGQIGLVTASLDRRRWRDGSVVARSVGLAAVTGLVVFPFADRLFPGRERWTIAVAIAAAAVFVIGRLRGERALVGDAVSTVIITAAENALRTTVLVVLLAADRVGLADLAIVAPFALSIVLLDRRPAGSPEADADAGDAARLWTGVLAGLPAVAAYAIVPGLTLLGEVADIDALAIATSLLRGPLLVATFASAWILQAISGTDDGPRLPLLVFPLLGLAHIAASSLSLGLIPGLVVHGGLSGVALMCAYLLTLGTLEDMSTTGALVGVAVVVAIATFVVALRISVSAEFVHPFLALTATSGVIAMTTGLSRRPTLETAT